MPPSDPSSPPVSALILAGGASSRMGQDKALLPVDGIPLLRRVYEAAAVCTARIYGLTAWPDRYRDILPDSCHWLPEVAHGNQPPGPLVAFAGGLRSLTTDWILLLACDLPHLQGATLVQWRHQLADLPPSAIAYLPRSVLGWEPLCGFYRRSCLTSLEAYLEQGGRSFQGWLAQQEVVAIAGVDPWLLRNCNTPEDWAALGNTG